MVPRSAAGTDPQKGATTVFAVMLLIDHSLIATFSVIGLQCYCTILKRMEHAFAASA
jgi:hypothetical protein